MNKIYSKKKLTVLDFGGGSVTVLIAKKSKDGSFEILGKGESEASGFEAGELCHLGDAVESVVEALRMAERASGSRTEKIFFNFDDLQIQSSFSQGSKPLKGEGEIKPSDVRDAGEVARRIVGHFEKQIVYCREIHFLIDERDVVTNPVGVFGRKLDVTTFVLQARSAYCELWQKLMKRSQIGESVSVLSAWSTAYGILPTSDRQSKKLILDLGKDFLNYFVYFRNAICEYKLLPSSENPKKAFEAALPDIKNLLKTHADIEKVLVTGELAQDEEFRSLLLKQITLPCEPATPLGVSGLSHPRFSSAAGLLHVADEMERTGPSLNRGGGLLDSVRSRAVSLINDYF